MGLNQKGAKVKLVIAGACLLVAGVLLADAFGVINLFGSPATEMKLTSDQEAALNAARAKDAEAAAKAKANPKLKVMDGREDPPK